ncbi:MAG TPA: anhydro-N-acetylmuramic acid kinase, partial [Bacteroidales bacterium]|nr:anhydro-N-acetylmuramic acid kinase [Bacteroidales bacterium]
RIAFDICPVNTVLNDLAAKTGVPYDREGEIARSGKTDEKLLAALNALEYYRRRPPKSLGREWLSREFYPELEKQALGIPDLMRTVCDHISVQVSQAVLHDPSRTMLVTGGGAYNAFLIDGIRNTTRVHVAIPGHDLVKFKEALVFALLGVLRWRGEPNCLSSVTGASADSSGGVIYQGPAKPLV